MNSARDPPEVRLDYMPVNRRHVGSKQIEPRMGRHVMEQPHNQSNPNEVWRWDLVPSDRIKKRNLQVTALLAVAVLGLLAWGVAGLAGAHRGSTRTVLVVGVFGVIHLVMMRTETKRALSTTLSIDDTGELRVSDSSEQTKIDLRRSDSINVRLRSGRTASHVSVESVADGSATSHQLANVAMYFPLERERIEDLGAQLEQWRSWANTNRQTSAAVSGQNHARSGQLSWAPPVSPNAERNRTITRVCFAAVILGIVASVVVTQWENGLSAVFFSMLAPALVLLLAVGIDLAFSPTRRVFKLDAAAGVLTVRASKSKTQAFQVIDLRSAQVTATIQTSPGASNHQTTIWKLSLDEKGEPHNFVIPTGLGTSFGRNDAIELESSLNGLINAR